jgi:hypothetical protein
VKTRLLIITLILPALFACNSGAPSQPVGNTNGAQPLIKAGTRETEGPKNLPIDLTIPASPQARTDAEVFDESVLFAPDFAINQNDPALFDLFDPKGDSNLCFPASLAEDLVYLIGYHQPKFSKLLLAGLSANGQSIEPNALIRQLTSLCKTDASLGTFSQDALRCALSVLSQSGYGSGSTQLISPFDQNSALPIISREVTIKDIRDALKAGTPVLLELSWFGYDSNTHQWSSDEGHYIGVYGYDYDESWGENEIQLKVINPEMNYGSSRTSAFWDTVTVERVSLQAGITYPANRPFILSGYGFGGASTRGFLGMMLTVSPGDTI